MRSDKQFTTDNTDVIEARRSLRLATNLPRGSPALSVGGHRNRDGGAAEIELRTAAGAHQSSQASCGSHASAIRLELKPQRSTPARPGWFEVDHPLPRATAFPCSGSRRRQ